MELIIKDLAKNYGSKTALQNFSHSFTRGICGILGPNGAGKSTLMNLITDNVKRSGGDILFDNTDILKLGKSFRAKVGYMPQDQGLYGQFSARAFLRYMAEIKGIPAKKSRSQIEELLDLVSLKSEAHRKLESYSGGMRQRVLLAQALLGDPGILILDEPTSGLDPKERIHFRSYITKLAENKLVLICTHIVSDIETIADEILLLDHGLLIQSGSPADLIKSVKGKNLEDVYMAYLGKDQ